MQNYIDTIMSQYANSPIITGLIEGINTMIDPTTDLTNFYNMVMNLNTATGYGLDAWGRIVGVGRNVSVDLTIQIISGFSKRKILHLLMMPRLMVTAQILRHIHSMMNCINSLSL